MTSQTSRGLIKISTAWTPEILRRAGEIAQVSPAFQGWFTVILWGIAVGLMAAGLYSTGKNSIGSQ